MACQSTGRTCTQLASEEGRAIQIRLEDTSRRPFTLASASKTVSFPVMGNLAT